MDGWMNGLIDRSIDQSIDQSINESTRLPIAQLKNYNNGTDRFVVKCSQFKSKMSITDAFD